MQASFAVRSEAHPDPRCCSLLYGGSVGPPSPPQTPTRPLSCFILDIPVRRDFYHSGSPRVPATREKKPNLLF